MAFELDYAGKITLDEFVRDYLSSIGYSSESHKYAIVLNHAVRGFKELAHESMPSVVGEIVEIGDNRRIEFTDIAARDVVFVGIVADRTKIPFFQDNELPLTFEQNKKTSSITFPDVLLVRNIFNQKGEFIGGFFGEENRVTNVGRYRIDEVGNSIVFDTKYKNIYIEYRTARLSKTGINYIPEIIVEPLICYIDYMMSRSNPSVSPFERQRLDRKLTLAKRLLRARNNPIDLNAMIKAPNRRNRQSPKLG